MIRDYLYFCPTDMNEFEYPLLQPGKLFFNSPCQFCTLIMAIGIDRTEFSPGTTGWKKGYIRCQKGCPKFFDKLLESRLCKCLPT